LIEEDAWTAAEVGLGGVGHEDDALRRQAGRQAGCLAGLPALRVKTE